MSIVEVARLAGVSNATVSRVINKHPSVSPETAKAVHAAMKRTGFVLSDRRPGPKPNSHRTSRTRRICLLVRGPSVSSVPPGFISLLRGVETACAAQKLAFQLKFVNDSEQTLRDLSENPADGALLHGDFSGDGLEAWLRRVPCVWLMANPRQPAWGDQAMPDNEATGTLAARYLLEKGHRRLACLNVRGSLWALQRRTDAFRAAATASGASVELLVGDAGSLERSSELSTALETLADRCAALSPRPTGFFVVDDRQMGLLHPVLLRRNLLSKTSAGLISCNHEEPYLEGLDPQPATIDIRFDAIGRLGVHMLLWRIENARERSRIRSTVEPLLVER